MTEATNKASVGLSFNATAVAAFIAKEPSAHRFRMFVKDGNLFIRPTYRARGPHVFADFIEAPKEGSNLKIELSSEQLEKLGHTVEQGSKFGVAEDKYGWFFLTKEGEGIEGAKAQVVKAA